MRARNNSGSKTRRFSGRFDAVARGFGVRLCDLIGGCGTTRIPAYASTGFFSDDPDRQLSHMLADGELDALVTARAPSTFTSRPNDVKRLFPNYVEVEKEYYRRTKLFPTMHTIVIRRDVYKANPWVAQSLYKAFSAAKAKAYELYNQTAALPAMEM